MWLVTTLIAAILATVAWFFAPRKYRLDVLGLMLWGATVMILVDHVLGYEGGPFLEVETEGMISSGALLGVVMLIPVFAVWIGFLAFAKKGKR